VDKAGNPTDTGIQLRFVEPPRLAGDLLVRTHQPTFSLPLKVSGNCEELLVKGKKVPPTKGEDGETVYRCRPITFDETIGKPDRRELKVELRSELSVLRNSLPDDTKVVTVEFLQRRLWAGVLVHASFWCRHLGRS